MRREGNDSRPLFPSRDEMGARFLPLATLVDCSSGGNNRPEPKYATVQVPVGIGADGLGIPIPAFARNLTTNASTKMNYKRTTVLSISASIFFGAMAIARDDAKRPEITNEFLQVTWEDAAGSFSARALPSGKLFAVAPKTNAGEGTVKKIVVTDRTFGTGDSLEVTGSDHSRDVVMLFPRLPFVLVRSTLHNSGEKPTTIRSVRPLTAILNLGQPASSLRTLGTAGLLAANQNPGSYAWLAVADPASAGVWLGAGSRTTAAAVWSARKSKQDELCSVPRSTTVGSLSDLPRTRHSRRLPWVTSTTRASGWRHGRRQSPGFTRSGSPLSP